MAKVYYEKDAPITPLKDKTILVVGYGSQGHAQAQNMKDSGLNVIVSLREDSQSWNRAKSDGFTVMTTREAAARADVIQILAPDTQQTAIYEKDIAPFMTAGKALVFSHGFNIHYFQIIPPRDVDVYMVAPKGPGHLVRRMFAEGKGVPCLIAVHQNPTGAAKQLALAHATAVGGTRAGVIETSFAEETETDLFGEQVVLCGGVTELVRAGFDTLVEAGYQPEIAYFECLHELKLIVDLIYESGITGMRYSISDTAEYGDITRGKRIINEHTRFEMRRILHEIQTGEFAREWILENQAKRPVFNTLQAKEALHLIEQVGGELRSMMPWLKKDK